jgi:NTP pyrophosphatase (non-canonical NTP hydrolase)
MSDMPRPDSLDALTQALRDFAAERDWDQFHSPKNLVMALSVEVAELMEHFQWLSAEEATELPLEKQAAVRDELADVLLYLTRLSDKLGVDVVAASYDKIKKNAAKYPADKARGSMRKYTEL